MVTIPTFQTTITEGPLADDKAVMLVARATDGWHHHVIVRPNWRKRLSVGHKMFAIGVASAIVLNILEVAKEEEGVSLKMIELSILHTETPGCREIYPKIFLTGDGVTKAFRARLYMCLRRVYETASPVFLTVMTPDVLIDGEF